MKDANLAVTEAVTISSPELLEVRVFTADGASDGYGAHVDSLTLDELTIGAANSLLGYEPSNRHTIFLDYTLLAQKLDQLGFKYSKGQVFTIQ